jgi:methyl-accepting chemotaxis protein
MVDMTAESVEKVATEIEQIAAANEQQAAKVNEIQDMIDRR